MPFIRVHIPCLMRGGMSCGTKPSVTLLAYALAYDRGRLEGSRGGAGRGCKGVFVYFHGSTLWPCGDPLLYSRICCHFTGLGSVAVDQATMRTTCTWSDRPVTVDLREAGGDEIVADPQQSIQLCKPGKPRLFSANIICRLTRHDLRARARVCVRMQPARQDDLRVLKPCAGGRDAYRARPLSQGPCIVEAAPTEGDTGVGRSGNSPVPDPHTETCVTGTITSETALAVRNKHDVGHVFLRREAQAKKAQSAVASVAKRKEAIVGRTKKRPGPS